MASPLVNAAIFLAVAGVTSAAGRQFRARAEGKPTYLSFLDGRLWLVAILVVATVAVTSGLVTIVNDGSAVMFWEFFIALAVFAAGVYLWAFLRSRHLRRR